MTQLFFRFYLGVLAVLFMAWWIYGYVLQWRYEADRARVITEAHASGVQLIADILRDIKPAERPGAISSIAKDFRCPLELLPLSELPAESRNLLDRSPASSYLRWESDRVGVAVAIDPQTYLRMGPFPNYERYAIEDSLRGWMRAAASVLRENGKPYDRGLSDLQSRFSLRLAIDRLGSLPVEAAERIKGDRDVVFYAKSDEQYFASTSIDETLEQTFAEGYMLTVGPFPRFSREERPAATATLALVLLPAALAILMLLRPVANQLRQVESAAQSIANGNLQSRVDENRIGSARNLARAFNQMACRTETMVRTQRELLQAVSHELKTPLARIRFAMDLASTATQESERIKRLSAIDDAVEDLDGLVEELINYVRMEDPSSPLRRESVSVLEVLDGVLHRYRALSADKVFESHAIDPRESLSIFADRAAFHRALGNLIGNATRFAAKKVAVSLSVDGGWVAIDIDDDGPGIPEADRGRVLEPFVRLDHQPPRDGNPTAAGVGLGLAIVRRTMEQHGARWEITDSPLGGCRVRTYWPLANPATNS